MTDTRTDRTRLARWAGLLLVAAVLPLAGPTPAAQAEPGCTNEQIHGFPAEACDDSTPPDTRISATSPTPNAAGWVKESTMTLTFAAVVTDGDTDEMKTECKLVGPSKAHDWQECTSPRTYEGLADTGAQAYTFSVRAFDSADRPYPYDDPDTLPPPFGTADADAPDQDQTPATFTWTQDTKVPGVSLLGGPYDREGTGWPIADSTRVTYLLDTDEDDVDFRCQVDGRVVPCSEGDLVIDDLRGGDHIVTAEATDAAGNKNTSVAVKNFTVPHNLTSGRNWKRVDGKGAFEGDLLQTRKAGATIGFPAKNVREVRLIAPGGGNLGKVRVRVADGIWHTINLGKGSKTARRSYFVQDFGLRSGRVVIESLATRKHPVRVDALVFPHD